MSDDGTINRDDALTSFLKFADDMREIHERYRRPAYQETCGCGGSVEVSKEVSPAERRRVWQHFVFRHRDCTAVTEELSPAREPRPVPS